MKGRAGDATRLYLRLIVVLCASMGYVSIPVGIKAQSTYEQVRLNNNPLPPSQPLAQCLDNPRTFTALSTTSQPYPQVTLSGGHFFRYSATSPTVTFLGGGYGTKRTFSQICYTNYTRTITMAFPKPVVNLRIYLNGSTDTPGNNPQTITATTNLGETISRDLVEDVQGYGSATIAFVPTSEVTSVTLTTSYTSNWLFSIDSLSFDWRYGRPPAAPLPEPSYCGNQTFARPAAEDLTAYGWSMHAEVSDRDGLVVSNVRLNGRLLAERVSVPYYVLETTLATPHRGELQPDSRDGTMRSRLVSYWARPDGEKLIVEATYVVDLLPGDPQSCLSVTQRYEFLNEGVYGPCEPSETLACQRWRPIVKYKFTGNNGEAIKSFNVAQRDRFTVNGLNRNSVGLFKDCDHKPGLCTIFEGGGFVFYDKVNPVFSEVVNLIISKGQAGQWDNVHETYAGVVHEPGSEFTSLWTNPGCPECMHTHWRWGAAVPNPAKFNSGQVYVPAGSDQSLLLGVVRYYAGEEHPNNFLDLLSLTNPEPIRTPLTGYMDPVQGYDYTAPEGVVLWYSATGYKNSDEFFSHYAFFNPSAPNITHTIGPSLAKSDSRSAALTSTVDGPVSVTYGNLFEDGPTTLADIDPALVGQLPTGFVVYNDPGYDIQTEAEVSGPHTVVFSVPSVLDQTTFDKLRIFHAERDPFDPAKAIWVDRTIIAPDVPAPDFANRTINARVDTVGPFVIGLLTQPQPPNTALSEIAVTSSDSSDPIIAGNDLTYMLTITNNGPQGATGVVFNDGLSPDVVFISAAASQGTCREENGTVICNIGALNIGAVATVTVVVKPTEGQARFPPEGKTIVNTVFVRANEGDTDQNNNISIETTLATPNPNAPPTINITSPTIGKLFQGPISFYVYANASDSDGSIASVEFFDNESSAGMGTASGNTYSLLIDNPSYGNHTLSAVATDNGGRKSVSSPLNYIVNGPAAVNLVKLAEGTLFIKPANISLEVEANYSGGSIAKVEFFANGDLIGATTTSPYSVIWNNAPSGKFAITAVATDNNEITSTSSPINITVTNAPIVNLTAPANGATYTMPATVSLAANARDDDNYVSRVDFYSDGSLIGTASNTAANLYAFTWNNAAVGGHVITAVATDGVGATATSAPINITILNAAPTASITSPSNGALYTAPASIVVNATAADSGGSVAKVEFFRDTTLIGTDMTSPYSITWSNAPPGTYSLTAKATDNFGTVGQSAAINVTVNNPPTVSMTAPTNGATFTALANISLSANASDTDGTISKVEFFRSTTLIGTVTSSPYNFVWSNVLPGSYSLTAKATDNRGAVKTSTAVSITVNSPGTVLFVVGGTTLNTIDNALKTRLLNLAFTVTVKSGSSVTTADATGKRVVVISETVTPTDVNTKFKTVAVPVVVLEPQLFDDMGMTGLTSGTNFGSTTSQTQITIATPSHAMAAGLTGNVTVVSAASTFGWGQPNANGVKVATIFGNGSRATIFGYSSGAVMPGLTSPARRVGFFLFGNSAALTTNGGSLFDASVKWAAGL